MTHEPKPSDVSMTTKVDIFSLSPTEKLTAITIHAVIIGIFIDISLCYLRVGPSNAPINPWYRIIQRSISNLLPSALPESMFVYNLVV